MFQVASFRIQVNTNDHEWSRIIYQELENWRIIFQPDASLSGIGLYLF